MQQHPFQPIRQFTLAEYLALDEGFFQKAEYWNGELLVMAGGTPKHASLGTRIIGKCYGHLGSSGSDCAVFGSDLRLFVPAA